ncbi:MAG: hypothetical protein B6242_16405, partial [Anaerolineaceae bacterium 4572_78]
GDLISDYIEVVGFNYDGKQWYLNPLKADTNNDGQLDTVECEALINVENNTIISSSGSYCQDIDNDKTPDIYDFDNDGDGVPDKVDESPYKFMGDINSGLSDQKFDFKLSSFNANKPIFVDIMVQHECP